MKSIKIASNLNLPLSIMTNKIAFMGGNGSGKTYASGKILEEVLDASGWVIILDPVGVHYGLRLDKSGKKPSGFDIPIFGGLHGDVPLTPTSGNLVADLLCDRRLSAILDVSQFESDSELNRFATDFGDQFWNRMKAQRRAVTLVLEECQEFIPQNPSKGEERKLHIFNRITKIGRNYGIGVMMISARPQDINKKSLNLTQLMFAFQMTGTHERKAMEEWFTYTGYKSDLGNLLPTLEVGQPYIMSPRALKINQQIKVLPKKTFDASATPDFDESSAETISLKPLDITQLQEAMSKQIAEVKANDPVELKKEISRLKLELERENGKIKEIREIRVEVPVITSEQVNNIVDFVVALNGIGSQFSQEAKRLQDSLNKVHDFVNNKPLIIQSKPSVFIPKKEIVGMKVSSVTYDEIKKNSNLSGPEQRILDAIAWFESIGNYTPKQVAVAFLSGYTYGGGAFNNPRGSLRTKGMVEYKGDSISLTESGRNCANIVTTPLTKESLQSHVLEILPRPEQEILKCLLGLYPSATSKTDLSEMVNRRGGAFNNPLGRLRTLGLIEYPQPAMVVALPFLFME